ncbi:hypothetical protein JOL62DRAFT_364558 [Phyllosticta paracitricarpa]|uniref:BZIP domain-containing protein n=2 Tax=Phyllosticta TaxID=121621 RepID=A0ABR1MVD2_9PEZI
MDRDHDAFDDPHDLFDTMSPANSAHAIFSPDSAFFDQPAVSTNPFFPPGHTTTTTTTTTTSSNNNNNNPYMRMAAHQQMPSYDHHQPVWPPMNEDDSRTPTSSMFGHDFNDSNYLAVGSSEPFPTSAMPMNVRPASVFQPTPSGNPPSPHSNTEWMAMAAQERESRPMNKRMRPNTPPGRSYSPFPRRDGIRKKNARFEIPPERSLLNIDQLIAQSSNEEEIKELKQQKRLLRNRQAALDSRQRKKRHTEELEEEKKLWTERVVQLEEELQNMRLQAEAIIQEKDQVHREKLEAEQRAHNLEWEKMEMVKAHTLESIELRKKVNILAEKLETQSSPMAAVPSSNFTDFAQDMDNLNMGGNDWDSYIYNDVYMDDQPPSNNNPQPLEAAAVVSRKKDSEQEKPVASGLLLMLLLCGAFVASNSGASPPAIPRMPDEVRAASASVLDSIFKDAGVEPSAQSAQNLLAHRVEALEPAPSGASWPKPTLSGTEFATISQTAGNPQFDAYAQLAAPTKEQEAEQAFSITPAQYNSLTSADFGRRTYEDGTPPATPTSQNRRNLAETLAAMREERKGETAAEVYTRSLLWDNIPTEVVREFKRMVEESGKVNGGGGSNGNPIHVKSETKV